MPGHARLAVPVSATFHNLTVGQCTTKSDLRHENSRYIQRRALCELASVPRPTFDELFTEARMSHACASGVAPTVAYTRVHMPRRRLHWSPDPIGDPLDLPYVLVREDAPATSRHGGVGILLPPQSPRSASASRTSCPALTQPRRPAQHLTPHPHDPCGRPGRTSQENSGC